MDISSHIITRRIDSLSALSDDLSTGCYAHISRRTRGITIAADNVWHLSCRQYVSRLKRQ